MSRVGVIFSVIALALLIAVAGITVRKCGEPLPDYTSQKVIDSLKSQVARYKTRETYYNSQAEAAYQRGLDAQKAKVVIRTIYRNDIEANHRLKKEVKDSLIKAMFSSNPRMDSSLFSGEVADGVLDLKSENKALRSDDVVDSLTIGELKVAYHAKDTALLACDSALVVQGGLVGIAEKDTATAKKKAKRRGFLNWVLGGLAVVFAIIAVSK